jgi:hypothetical protein
MSGGRPEFKHSKPTLRLFKKYQTTPWPGKAAWGYAMTFQKLATESKQSDGSPKEEKVPVYNPNPGRS